MSATSSCTRATAGRPDPHHQVHRLGRRLGHRVLHPPVGVGRIAEQLGAVGAQLHDLGDQRIVVVGIAIVAALDERLPHLLAQARGWWRSSAPARPPSGCWRWHSCPPAGPLPWPRPRRHPSRRPGRPPSRPRSPECRSTSSASSLALKSEKADGKLLVIVRQLGLLRVVELGAAADEALIGAGQQPHLLGIEADVVAMLVERCDPREQLRVEVDLVVGRRQLGRPFLVERLILRASTYCSVITPKIDWTRSSRSPAFSIASIVFSKRRLLPDCWRSRRSRAAARRCRTGTPRRTARA